MNLLKILTAGAVGLGLLLLTNEASKEEKEKQAEENRRKKHHATSMERFRKQTFRALLTRQLKQ